MRLDRDHAAWLVPWSAQRNDHLAAGTKVDLAPASPNQRPTCSGSVISSQTRSTGASMTVSRSIWSGTM